MQLNTKLNQGSASFSLLLSV